MGDENYDNLVDETRENSPTHFYWIMMRNGESMSFILPNYKDTIDCNIDLATSTESQLVTLLKQHLARIRDVEQLVGLNFEFGELSIEGVQSRLFIREWADFWNEEEILSGLEPTPTPTPNPSSTSSLLASVTLLALVFNL